tara:strand:- start:452 stop:1561 length:1110 start_codon:yes stop_codon:yes gene_type:complete
MSLTRFDKTDVRVQTNKLTTSTWSDNTNNLQEVYTSSLQSFNSPTSSKWNYLEVYHKSPDPEYYSLTGETDVSSDAEVQLSLAYGNRLGSGSPDFTNDTGSFGFGASRAVYGQYRQLVYGQENQNFTFGTHTPDDIYVININRARYKNSLALSTLQLWLSGSSPAGLGNTKRVTKLTDDSITSNGQAIITNIGRQFNIVSGSNGVAVGGVIKQIGGSASFGLFYPDAGLIILNPDAFDSGSDGGTQDLYPQLFPGRNTGLSTNTDNNPERLYHAISGAGHFIVDSEETITSQFYFVRAKNFEYNYTTNPTFQDENGNVQFTSMINNPRTYITTVGLYNDNNDLLAVAKMSQPIAKDPTKEALFRIKLDF